MKFTTPCFVRIDNAKERKELIKWLEGIGYTPLQMAQDGYGDIVFSFADGACDTGDDEDLKIFKNNIDCDENIELFKALAAMNDEDWHSQYVVDNAGNWGFCEIIPDARHLPCRCVTMLCLTFNIDNYRKATAEEIIEHFKNERK